MNRFRFSLRRLMIVMSGLTVLMAIVGIGWRTPEVLAIGWFLFWIFIIPVVVIGSLIIASIQEEFSRRSSRIRTTSRIRLWRRPRS